MGTKHLRLDQVTHFVLDEADRMLDLGFIRDIRHIVAALPTQRQSMLFSATMPAEVGQLANSSPARPGARGESRRTSARRRRSSSTCISSSRRTSAPCSPACWKTPAMARVIVFTRTKHGANKVADHLTAARVQTEALHGNKSQAAREKSLDRFRSGRARVLVATDIASRGIDVTGISHVINFDLPVEPESYVHRIGRTARAGSSGHRHLVLRPHGTRRAARHRTRRRGHAATGGRCSTRHLCREASRAGPHSSSIEGAASNPIARYAPPHSRGTLPGSLLELNEARGLPWASFV